MKTSKRISPRYAICIDNAGYPASLELHKIYRVVADEDAAADGDVRVIDESGEDYLYPAEYFIILSLPLEKAAALDKSFTSGAPHPA